MESKKFIGCFTKIKFLSADYIFSIDNYFNSGIYGCHTGLCVVFAAFNITTFGQITRDTRK